MSDELVLRPHLGCLAAAVVLLLGAPLGGGVAGWLAGQFGAFQGPAGGWVVAAGIGIGTGITLYVVFTSGRRAGIVVDSDAVKVRGMDGGVQSMRRSAVGWIELAKGSLTVYSMTHGARGAGQIEIHARTGSRRLQLSVDQYNTVDAMTLARHLGVPLLMSHRSDKRRWWWTGQAWQEVTQATPAAPVQR